MAVDPLLPLNLPSLAAEKRPFTGSEGLCVLSTQSRSPIWQIGRSEADVRMQRLRDLTFGYQPRRYLFRCDSAALRIPANDYDNERQASREIVRCVQA